MSVLSPLMRQYVAIKEQYRDTLLLFQVGDFYELFFEDAQVAAQFLGITLTKRGMIGDEPIPLCGVPVHMVDHYLQKLVKGGFKVALCKQQSEPVPGKIVERAVTQVITPGTIVEASLMNDMSSHYLVALMDAQDTRALVVCEIVSGSFFVTLMKRDDRRMLEDELCRISPIEILIDESFKDSAALHWCRAKGYVISLLENNVWNNYLEQAREYLKNAQHPLLKESAGVICATQLLIAYLIRNQSEALRCLRDIQWYVPHDYLQLDEATQRNLELAEPLHHGTKQATLFEVLNEAITAMGARCIKKWLLRPLIVRAHIEKRHHWVDIFKNASRVCLLVRSHLQEIGDFERIIGRIVLRKAPINDYRMLMRGLSQLQSLVHIIQRLDGDDYFHIQKNHIDNALQLWNQLTATLNTDDSKPWLIREGFNQELDHARNLVARGNELILALERDEQVRTGINSLKIRDHQSHGYGIEVTKANLHLVPAEYIRVQSLVNKDRFTSNALKELEYELRQAHVQCADLEQLLFAQLTEAVVGQVNALRTIAEWLMRLDAITTFAFCAYQRGYVRPQLVDESTIYIKNGKHPVIAELLKHEFKPNSVCLDDDQRLLIITGPNMGGKSTYLRQIALQIIMNQIGSFIPAESAQLMIVDRIFTRIGASDNVARGESTFYVEMKEAATICSLATAKSLVILDEIGRGTSTYDGLALAQAILEYMYEERQSRCLFATHYQELCELSGQFRAIKNYHAASLSEGDKVILLHEIKPGIAEGSFGIAVAQMAQMPAPIIARARILKHHYETR
jgi:DNA mismatch repair protein MutS